MTSRRDFIKTACGLCAMLGTAGLTATLLEGCSSIPVVKATPQNDRLVVPLASLEKIPALIRRSNMLPDILLVKKQDGTYSALLMQCSHEAQPLTLAGSSIYCSTHGSSFDLNGNVTHAPATQPLIKYPVTTEGESIVIQLKPLKP